MVCFYLLFYILSLIESVLEILRKYHFPNISDANFSYFRGRTLDTDRITDNGNNINLYVSERNPADLLLGAHIFILSGLFTLTSEVTTKVNYWSSCMPGTATPSPATSIG